MFVNHIPYASIIIPNIHCLAITKPLQGFASLISDYASAAGGVMFFLSMSLVFYQSLYKNMDSDTPIIFHRKNFACLEIYVQQAFRRSFIFNQKESCL